MIKRDQPETRWSIDRWARYAVLGYLFIGGSIYLLLDLFATSVGIHAAAGVTLAQIYFTIIYPYPKSWRREAAIFLIPLLTSGIATLFARGICTWLTACNTCTPNQMAAFSFGNFSFPLVVILVNYIVREGYRIFRFYKSNDFRKK